MDLQDNSYGKHEQIVSQFLLKSLHIILHSRVPAFCSPGRGSDMLSGTPVKRSDKWFSLVLGDRPAALDNLNFWHRNLVEPMIIDILLVQEVLGGSSENAPSALGLGDCVETVIERWVVQYEYARTAFPLVGESSSYKKTYKKSIILLRSLYSMMRLLPAYKAFRKICSSSQHSDFAINYKISSFCVPFSREEESVTKQYDFHPVDTPQGRLSISVTYRESLSDFNLDTSTSFPLQIITDYVGSPAADPFKAFASLEKGVSAASSPLRGVRPPSSPFQRPHSWTSGLHRISHAMPLGGSPPIHRTSTASYDSPSPPTDVNVHRIQNYRVPTHHNSTSFHEYQLSPPFSPSPISSSPTYLLGGNPIHTRGHSETAPVSIPHQVLGRSPKYLSPNLSDPNRSLLPPLSPRSTKLDPSSQDSSSGIRLSRKLDLLRAGELSSGMINQYSGQKVSRDSKDESGRFSGVLSSSGSPRVGVSRSSSRLSFQEDLDDCDFSCPFIVDDVDTLDSPDSQNLDGRKGTEFTSQAFSASRKYQDAAASALVHILRSAPPLRQDSSCYSSLPSKMEPDGEVASASAMSMPRKTSDALEELKAYRELKDLLLSKSGTLLEISCC
ncbi:autophagy-related protein 13a isoform X2 [Diospyros lotus]|uniref:autophagy-related protein 13a isoform X2 n=1 Tax=Diospyros lotus TaxID=55363 RepID=UPI002250CFCA|nr:autophagy-related protein 13a isoform X2 [Diospyros lotus]